MANKAERGTGIVGDDGSRCTRHGESGLDRWMSPLVERGLETKLLDSHVKDEDHREEQDTDAPGHFDFNHDVVVVLLWVRTVFLLP